jgi:hypothetical protein
LDEIEEKYKNDIRELKDNYKQMKIYIISSYKNGKKDNDDFYKLYTQQLEQKYYKNRQEINNKYSYD